MPPVWLSFGIFSEPGTNGLPGYTHTLHQEFVYIPPHCVKFCRPNAAGIINVTVRTRTTAEKKMSQERMRNVLYKGTMQMLQTRLARKAAS
jgi:hypothetical protein